MINIPEEVKQLFKQNSVSKNFRVSFPNGEYRDLVNKDFVSESVIFTESIGSTDGLKLGLSEGSTLEFQTYFNENIKNLKIFAEMEIDVSSIVDYSLPEYAEPVVTTMDINTYEASTTLSNKFDYFTIHSHNGESTNYNIIFEAHYDELKSIFFRIIDEPYDDVSFSFKYICENFFPEYADDINTIDVTVMFNYAQGIIPDTYKSDFSYYECINSPLDYKESDDVPYPYVSVPYGYFWVDSCKRDGTDNIRRVIAYQNKWDLSDNSSKYLCLSEDEIAKFRVFHTNKSNSAEYTAKNESITNLISSCLNSVDVLEATFAKHDETVNTSTHHYDQYIFDTDVEGITSLIYVEIVSVRCVFWDDSLYPSGNITIDPAYDPFYSITPQYRSLQELKFDTIDSYSKRVHDAFIDYLTESVYYDRKYPNTSPEDKFSLFGDDRVALANGIDVGNVSKLITQFMYPVINYCPSGEKYTSKDTDHIGGDSFDNTSVSRGLLNDKISDSRDKLVRQKLYIYPYIDDFYSVKQDVDNVRYVNHADLYIPVEIRIREFTKDSNTSETLMDSIKYYDLPVIEDTIEINTIYLGLTSDNLLTLFGDIKLPVTKLDGEYRDRDTVSHTTHYRYSTENEIKNLSNNIINIIQGFSEMRGGFLRKNRVSGRYDIVHIKNTNSGLFPRNDLYPNPQLLPDSQSLIITRNIWRSVWFDDDRINDFNKVYCNFANSENGTVYIEVPITNTNIQFNSAGYQSYDISENYLIKSYGAIDGTWIEDFLEYLAVFLSGINYYPATIEMRGLPYVESGDSISVITRDSGFTTVCLRHRISGIQSLTDNIESR